MRVLPLSRCADPRDRLVVPVIDIRTDADATFTTPEGEKLTGIVVGAGGNEVRILVAGVVHKVPVNLITESIPFRGVRRE